MRVGRLSVAKMPVLPKMVESFNAAPTKNPSKVICRNRLILIVLWKSQWPRTAKTILNKKNKGAGVTLANSEAHSVAAVVKTNVASRRDRRTGRWSGAEDPEIDPKYVQLAFDRDAETLGWGSNAAV